MIVLKNIIIYLKGLLFERIVNFSYLDISRGNFEGKFEEREKLVFRKKRERNFALT